PARFLRQPSGDERLAAARQCAVLLAARAAPDPFPDDPDELGTALRGGYAAPSGRAGGPDGREPREFPALSARGGVGLRAPGAAPQPRARGLEADPRRVRGRAARDPDPARRPRPPEGRDRENAGPDALG